MESKNSEEMPLQEIASLRSEVSPPAGLEDRVVSALRKEGLLRSSGARSRRLKRTLGAIAACLVLFFSGWWIGTTTESPATGITYSDSTFVFFLMQGPEYQSAANELEQISRIKEYGNWARSIRARGVPMTGMKLRPKSETLGGTKSTSVVGYFLIDAKDFSEAAKIARTCPHLRYRGQIEVRQIHPV